MTWCNATAAITAYQRTHGCSRSKHRRSAGAAHPPFEMGVRPTAPLIERTCGEVAIREVVISLRDYVVVGLAVIASFVADVVRSEPPNFARGCNRDQSAASLDVVCARREHHRGAGAAFHYSLSHSHVGILTAKLRGQLQACRAFLGARIKRAGK